MSTMSPQEATRYCDQLDAARAEWKRLDQIALRSVWPQAAVDRQAADDAFDRWQAM